MAASAPGMGRGIDGAISSVVWLLRGDQPDNGDLGGRVPMSLRLQKPSDLTSQNHITPDVDMACLAISCQLCAKGCKCAQLQQAAHEDVLTEQSVQWQ